MKQAFGDGALLESLQGAPLDCMADSAAAAEDTVPCRGEVAAAEAHPNLPSLGSPQVNTRLKNAVRGGGEGGHETDGRTGQLAPVVCESDGEEAAPKHHAACRKREEIARRIQPAALDARKHTFSAAGLAKGHGPRLHARGTCEQPAQLQREITQESRACLRLWQPASPSCPFTPLPQV